MIGPKKKVACSLLFIIIFLCENCFTSVLPTYGRDPIISKHSDVPPSVGFADPLSLVDLATVPSEDQPTTDDRNWKSSNASSSQEAALSNIDLSAQQSFLKTGGHVADDLFKENLTRVGYDGGFVIASKRPVDLNGGEDAYRLVINGWGQLRDTVFDSRGAGTDLNQLQLKRARIVFSGNAFNPDFRYFVQLDGRSNSGDSVRILDYYLTYDFGHRNWSLDRDAIGFKTGLYKMPFSLARQLSGKELEFADRSMSSTYFDVNRSLAWGLYGTIDVLEESIFWEAAIFNGLVTGGAETGSSGDLDNNNAFSARLYSFPMGEWQTGQLADLNWHHSLATRVGAGLAFTTVSRSGSTEFNGLLSVDSGATLATLLPLSVTDYDVAMYSIDGSLKLFGLSATCEYYFRNVSNFRGAEIDALFDHGFWLQAGLFVLPGKIELLSRWSRVQGSSGTLGASNRSSEEIATGFVNYFKEQHAKLTVDATYLNGASINSSSLDIAAGDIGWLYRTQLQFSF